MLITELKSKETLDSLVDENTVIIRCEGCKEVHFPEKEANEFSSDAKVSGTITTDYICNPENLAVRMEKHKAMIDSADQILILSCGVGVQTVAEFFQEKKVSAGCDTYPLPGFQGVTPLEYDCDQCGECYLNYTGGICPITACSKSLVNGQCGGSKNGKCEVDSDMECGWERIYRRLESLDHLEVMNYPTKVRNYNTDEGK